MTRGQGLVPDAPPWLGLLLVVLDRHVSLPGALCVGQAPGWDRELLPGEDDTEHAERLRYAFSVCRVCPARPACPAPLRNVPRADVHRVG